MKRAHTALTLRCSSACVLLRALCTCCGHRTADEICVTADTWMQKQTIFSASQFKQGFKTNVQAFFVLQPKYPHWMFQEDISILPDMFMSIGSCCI